MWGKPKLMQIIPSTNENDRNQREQGRSQEYILGGAGLQQRYTKYNF